MAELILTSEEAMKYVELIGDKITNSITYEPIFPLYSKIIALVPHRVLGENKYCDIIFIVRKTKNGVDGRIILNADDLICIPAKKKKISIEYAEIFNNILQINVKIEAENKIFLADYKCIVLLDDIFAV